MQASTLWAAGTVGGLIVLGAAAGIVFSPTSPYAGVDLSPGALVASLVFGSTFLASGLAMQLYRRGLDHSTLVGAVAGGLGVFSFFAASLPFAFAAGDGMETGALLVLLLVLPLLAAGCAGAGTLMLAQGVRRYREKHGMQHAPK